MKSIKTCIVIAALCCMAPAMAQKKFASEKYSAMCNYYGEATPGNITLYDASPTADKVVQNIMSVIGLRSNFELRAANVPTAAAVIKQNKRYIMYNPQFMNKINSASGTNWAAISILAHEIGHHLSGHTLDNMSSKPQTELEADEFSGFVLQKMGATLADAQAAMALIASQKGSHTHPPKSNRLTAIASGWNKAAEFAGNSALAANRPQVPVAPQNPAEAPKQQVAAATTTAVSKPAVQSRTEKIQQSVLSTRNIASDAYFASDPQGKYYVTVKGNLVQVDKDKVYLVGSLSQSDKPGYRLMLTDKAYNNIYIGTGGALVNNSGKRVGYLRAR
jgi:hypothetical protein